MHIFCTCIFIALIIRNILFSCLVLYRRYTSMINLLPSVEQDRLTNKLTAIKNQSRYASTVTLIIKII